MILGKRNLVLAVKLNLVIGIPGRTGTSYNSIYDTGPAGHPKANSFSPILFEKNIAPLLWLDNAVKKGKGLKGCHYRCKGHNRLKRS